VEEQTPFGPHVTGKFASPVVDLKPDESGYAPWLRGAYPGLAKTTLKKERRLGRDVGEVRFEFDERDPRMLRRLMQWKSGPSVPGPRGVLHRGPLRAVRR